MIFIAFNMSYVAYMIVVYVFPLTFIFFRYILQYLMINSLSNFCLLIIVAVYDVVGEFGDDENVLSLIGSIASLWSGVRKFRITRLPQSSRVVSSDISAVDVASCRYNWVRHPCRDVIMPYHVDVTFKTLRDSEILSLDRWATSKPRVNIDWI